MGRTGSDDVAIKACIGDPPVLPTPIRARSTMIWWEEVGFVSSVLIGSPSVAVSISHGHPLTPAYRFCQQAVATQRLLLFITLPT
jgi:hypothetical protein